MSTEPQLLTPPDRDLPPNRMQVRRAALLEELSRESVRPRPVQGLVRSRQVRVGLAAAVAVLIAVQVSLSLGLLGGTQTAAAKTLERLADKAGAQKQAVLAPGDFSYLKVEDYSKNSDNQGILAAETLVTQSWVQQDGSGRQVEDRSAPVFFSEADRAAWVRTYGDPKAEHKVYELDPGSGEIPMPDGSSIPASQLPSGPDTLWTLLESGLAGEGGGPDNWRSFQAVWELMWTPSVSPQVRAALFTLAARIPDVRYDRRVTDDVGRLGMSFSFDSTTNGPLRQEVIVDPDTSALLEMKTVSTATGAVYEAHLVLESGVASSKRSVPRTSLLPAPTESLQSLIAPR